MLPDFLRATGRGKARYLPDLVDRFDPDVGRLPGFQLDGAVGVGYRSCCARTFRIH